MWTTAFTDAFGRASKVRTPDNAIARTSYSGNTVTVTDQAAKARKSVTDALGRLTSIYEDPGGLNYQTSYTYDVLDDLLTVTQGVQTRTFVYNSLKRLTSAYNPESGTVNYTYDNNGNMLTKLDALSITTTIGYDVLNRPTSRSYTDGTPAVAYFYDSQSLPAGAPSFSRGYATGRAVAVTYGGTSAGNYVGYDALGRTVRKIQQTDSVNYLVEAVYNVSGAMTSETYPSIPGSGDRRTITSGYDTAGRLSSINTNATTYAPAANISSIIYASHGALASETYGNSLIHAATYNNRLQTSQIKLGTAGNPTSILSLLYNFGSTTNNGNIQSITYTGGGLSYTQTFTYDSLNRLATAQENAGSSWSQTNGYDRYANRWIALPGGAQSIYCNTSNNRITGWSYDASGNLLNDGAMNYTYDAEGHIKTVNGATAYKYDGGGQRIRKLVGENIRFVYGIAGELIAEFDGASGSLKKEYVYGGGSMVTIEPTAINSNGTRYSTADHLGSPRVITSSSGGVVSRHDYMPFGEELFAGTGGRTVGMGFSVADGNRKKFTGYERDNDTGLDFAQARYNSSNLGRFTSPDPFGGSAKAVNPQTFNRYAYVGNNPVNATDPSGLKGERSAEDHSHNFDWAGNEMEKAEKQYAGIMKDVSDANLARVALSEGDMDTAIAILSQNSNVRAVNEFGRDVTDELLASSQTSQTSQTSKGDDVIRIDVSVGGKTGVSDSPAQVIIFRSTRSDILHPKGVGGHVAYVIDGLVWSWEGDGWAPHVTLKAYMKANRYRSATGYVLDFGSVGNIRFKEALIFSYDGAGGYKLLQNNCGEGFCRAINAIGGKPWERGATPADHERYITGQLQPRGFVKEIIQYPGR